MSTHKSFIIYYNGSIPACSVYSFYAPTVLRDRCDLSIHYNMPKVLYIYLVTPSCSPTESLGTIQRYFFYIFADRRLKNMNYIIRA